MNTHQMCLTFIVMVTVFIHIEHKLKAKEKQASGSSDRLLNEKKNRYLENYPKLFTIKCNNASVKDRA